jgi:hypothetical protein
VGAVAAFGLLGSSGAMAQSCAPLTLSGTAGGAPYAVPGTIGAMASGLSLTETIILRRSGRSATIILAGRVARERPFKIISVDYRMAPDFPCPAALDDAMAVGQALLHDHDPRRMGIFGTSAGGGLTLVPDYYARFPKLCVVGWGRRSLNVTQAGRVLPCHAAESIPASNPGRSRTRCARSGSRTPPSMPSAAPASCPSRAKAASGGGRYAAICACLPPSSARCS